MGTIIKLGQLKMNLKKNIYLYENSTTERCPKEIMKVYLSKFSKKLETAYWYNQGLGGNCIMKKT
jgi:hypothetical protein